MLHTYKELIENNIDIVWEIDLNGRFISINPVVEMILGYKVEEIIGKTIYDLMPREIKAEIKLFFKDCVLNQRGYTRLENINIHKNGSAIILESSAVPIFNDAGTLIAFKGLDRDITEKKKLQKEHELLNIKLQEKVEEQTKVLREVITRYEFAVKASNDGLWDWNLLTNEVYYSNRWKGMLGYNENELENNFDTWSSLIHPDDYEKCMMNVNDCLSGKKKSFRNEHRLKHKNGSWVWVLDKGKIFFDEYGKAIRLTGFHTDITNTVERNKFVKEQEQMNFQESKLNSMRELLGNIAHQWRQPLSTVSAAVGYLKMSKEFGNVSPKDMDEAINTIEHSVEYLSRTIDEFRSFFKPAEQKSVCNTKDLVNDALKIVSSECNSCNIEIKKDIESVEVFLYRNEILQVLVSILNNAKDILNTQEMEKYIFIKIYEFRGTLKIIIYDNGGGMEDEIMQKAFEPYFTTSHQSQGKGLGLFMSEEIIVKQMNGEIEASNVYFDYEDKEYKGAEFRITLPLK